MTFNEYQNLARRTQNKTLSADEKRKHALFGMCSEVGEIHSIYQHVYQGEKVNLKDLSKEIGDCMWFISELCDALGIMLDAVAEMNIDKLRKRYPAGFDDEKSIHRHD